MKTELPQLGDYSVNRIALSNLLRRLYNENRASSIRMIDSVSEESTTKEIWVNAGEGAEATGYSREYVTKLAMRMAAMPEDERKIRLKKRANRYELWLPDLLNYVENIGHGPKAKRKPQTS